MEVAPDYEWGRIVATAVALGAVLGLGLLTRAAVRRINVHPEQRLRVRRAARYALALLLLTVVVVIWADALRAAALVISAFAVAIVIGGKELITCVLGWYLKISSGSYRIGHRVQIGDVRGDVVDYGILTTTLLEVVPGSAGDIRTGRVVTLPNSLVLTQPVRTAGHTLRFVWKEVTAVVRRDEDWRAAERLLLEAGRREAEAWSGELVQRLRELREAEDVFVLDEESAEPRVLVGLLEDGRVRLSLRLAVPMLEAAEVEDRVLRRFLAAWAQGAG